MTLCLQRSAVNASRLILHASSVTHSIDGTRAELSQAMHMHTAIAREHPRVYMFLLQRVCQAGKTPHSQYATRRWHITLSSRFCKHQHSHKARQEQSGHPCSRAHKQCFVGYRAKVACAQTSRAGGSASVGLLLGTRREKTPAGTRKIRAAPRASKRVEATALTGANLAAL